jgi:glycosyltransferase involved in cell wall biosynthesis
VEELAGPVLDVFFRPYTDDEQQIRRDLWSSRLVLMPSRHEGFGLAAYEAIAAGVPVLISEESGLADMLTELVKDDENDRPRVILPVRGDPDTIRARWSDEIGRVLANPRECFERAARIRETILAEVSWARTVSALLAELGITPPSGGR